MNKKGKIKLQFIPIFILTVLLGCNLNKSNKNNFESEKILIERMQLDCYKQFLKSNNLKYSIEDVQYDISNPILSKIAENQINISNKIDNNIKEIFFKIEELKISLVSKSISKSSKNNYKIQTPLSRYNFLNPSIIDIQIIEFIDLETKEIKLKSSIIEIQQKIKNVQNIISNEFNSYYGIKSIETKNNKLSSNFNSYKTEFDSFVIQDDKSKEFLCGASFERKLIQIINELNFNKEYWSKAYSNKSSTPILFCNLINLQSDLIYTRSLIFEMITQNLYCESLKYKN